jgi:hypothetical protein
MSPQSPAQYIPSSQIISSPQSDSVPSLGGVVHFKKFSNIDKLKEHQKALKEQLQELHKVIIESPEMTKRASGGELSIQGGAKKKKKTESININEAINDLIGGNKIFDIFNYYQNEIVEKQESNEKYVVDFNDSATFSDDAIKNVLNLKNKNGNTITFTKLEDADNNKFEKSSNRVIYLEKDNGFQNQNISGDPINKFIKLEHSKMIELLGEVNPANLNKPIVFDSEFYTSDIYKSLFQNASSIFK